MCSRTLSECRLRAAVAAVAAATATTVAAGADCGLLLLLHGPVTEEQIVKVRIVNLTRLVTENLLTHRLINLNVCLPEIVVLLIWAYPVFQTNSPEPG